MLQAPQVFATAIQGKFAPHVAGEPEDQVRAPFEQRLGAAGKAIGINVVVVGETLLADHMGGPTPAFRSASCCAGTPS